jgi:PEP-CTERM motif
MKNYLLAALVGVTCTFAAISLSSGQTASFIYNDGTGAPNSGSYAPGSSFTFSITLAFTAGGTVTNLEGLSYWFEQQSPNPPFSFAITLRDATGSNFTDLQTPGLTYPQALNPQNAGDLGGLQSSLTGVGNGSYFVANITFSINASAAPGTYVIQNTTTGGKRSVASDDQGHTVGISQAPYTLTVVPEPGTFSLLALAGLGATGLGFFRRKR